MEVSSEQLLSNLEEVLGNWGAGSHGNHVFKQDNFQRGHTFHPHQQCVRVPIVQYSVSNYHYFSLFFNFS